MKILAATNNEHKLREFSQILTPYGFEVISIKDAGIDIDPEENGKTFEENALIKATAFSEASGLPVISDDSGLEVMALDLAPGVYSARYAPGSDKDRVNKLLENMKGLTNRTARFVSALVIAFPDGKTLEARGECYGRITESPAGENGFGYDPVFYVEKFGKTFAELTMEEKNSISHRGKAVRKMAALLTEAQ